MKILLIHTGYYPDKDAGAIRVTTFAKMLKNIGHEPIVACYGKFDNYKIETIDEIDYVSLIPRFRNFKKSVKELLCNKIIVPDLIWIYWAPFPAFIYLKKYAIKHKISLIHDSVEWYSAQGFMGKFKYTYMERNLVNKYVINKKFNVISISNYLDNYYSNKKINSIVIPVLMDVKNIKCDKNIENDGKIHLLYAGSPANSKEKRMKDDLLTLLNGLSSLENNLCEKVKLTLIGVNKQNILDNYNIDIDMLNVEICAKGRIPRSEVLKELTNAHFTVLLRDANARYAKAGFPSKVVESLSTATPVICNLSSDLSNYLKDNVNSIIIESNSSFEIEKAIKRIVALSEDDLKKMQLNARYTAENSFDYNLYENKIKEFLQ